MNIIGVVLVVVVIIGGLVWEVVRVTAPPRLTVDSPADNLLTAEHRVELAGSATPESAVTVNGSPVSLSSDGSFHETLDLRTGLNIITVSASKKFAAPKVVYRRVVVSGDEGVGSSE